MTLEQNLASLFKVKTLVTLAVIGVFAVLALRGDVTEENIMIVVVSVISFYFGKYESGKEPQQ